MKKVNSLSGGKTSSYLAVHYPADYNVFSLVCIDDKECAPKDKLLGQYVNDKLKAFVGLYGDFIATAEDDATIKAMMDLEQLLGQEIFWVRGRSFDEIIDIGSKTRLPTWARRYCTTQMKIEPIFTWCFQNIGERCEMRIGFRFDEFARMERFFNNSNPTTTKVPISCRISNRRQSHEEFNWRFCSFPLIRDGISKKDIDLYWEVNGWIGGNLFEERRQIQFPKISNCVGCFHKKVDTLSIMAAMHPEKMAWFSRQEDKGKGTWLDSRLEYKTIIENSDNYWIPEMLSEDGAACDSGGCHD